MTTRKSIFLKLFLTYLLILFLSFLLFGIIFNYLIMNTLYNNNQRTFEHHREQLVEHIQYAHDHNWDQELLQSSLELSMNQESRMIYIYDQKGNLKYYPKPSRIEEFGIDSNTVQNALNGEEIAERMKRNDQFLYLMAAPIDIPTEETPRHAIVMVFHEYDNESREIIWLNITTIFITVLFTGIIIFFISRRITKPLRDMNETALRYAKGDFSQTINVKSKDELGQLGETFNYMAKELDSLDQMRKDFVANVSHDLRSPLTSIKGFLMALEDGTIPKERYHHYFSIMKNETERLIKLVNDLLDVTKLEAGQFEIKPISYNVSEQLRLIIAKMEPELVKYQIDIELMGEDEDIIVFADPDRIEQVITNLIQNAIQFSSVESRIEVNLNKNADLATICIQDHGQGINEEDQKHVWERFYKVDKARSNKVGTGIGLSIVKYIIDLHHTSISMQSKVGEGSVFTFTLPLSKRAQQEKE